MHARRRHIKFSGKGGKNVDPANILDQANISRKIYIIYQQIQNCKYLKLVFFKLEVVLN